MLIESGVKLLKVHLLQKKRLKKKEEITFGKECFINAKKVLIFIPKSYK